MQPRTWKYILALWSQLIPREGDGQTGKLSGPLTKRSSTGNLFFCLMSVLVTDMSFQLRHPVKGAGPVTCAESHDSQQSGDGFTGVT